uniref:Serpentine receptor class gamma n=1 Tax=Steinernema glaseri TaxID=37863 RepID=A0A1I7YLA2_9BILA
MRTIGVILMVFVAAYFLVQLVNFVILYAHMDESLPVIEFIRGMSVVPIMITFSQGFYVYWWRSREYRAVFKQQLKMVFRCVRWEQHTPNMITSSRGAFPVSHVY